MGMWNLLGGGRVETWGPVASTSVTGPSITAGTANVKGSWVQISTGLSWPTAGIHITLEQFSVGGTSWAIDVGLGSPGNEVVVLANLLGMGSVTSSQFIPLAIPTGTAISVRMQSPTASLNARCGIWTLPETSGMLGISRWTTYGFNSGSTTGTVIDSGGTANTLSAWTQIVTGSANPVRLFYLMYAGVTLTGNTSTFGLVDVGVGGAGVEFAVLRQFQYRLATGSTPQWLLGPFGCDRTASSRWSVRHQSNSIVVASSRNMQWSILAGG